MQQILIEKDVVSDANRSPFGKRLVEIAEQKWNPYGRVLLR